jgi:hypothetical protein
MIARSSKAESIRDYEMDLGKAGDLASWAVSRNVGRIENGVSNLFSPSPGGMSKLIRYAVYYSRLLELCSLGRQWGLYLECAVELAFGIHEGVFTDRGPETARDLLLCILGDAGFCLRESLSTDAARQELLELIEKNNKAETLQKLNSFFDCPPTA